MQKCSICEKPLYGHPLTKGKIVCGSCPLNKSEGADKAGKYVAKNVFQVRMDLAKVVTKKHPDQLENEMSQITVKSNVPNHVILLDGKHPVRFDAKGIGKVALQHLAHLEREMKMKPGRFSIVSEEAPVQVPAPVETKVEEVLVTVEPEKVVEAPAIEEIPSTIDQSFLTEEQKPEKAKKASKK